MSDSVNVAYASKEWRKGHSSVPGKGKELAGCRSNIANAAADSQGDQDRSHGRCAAMAVGYVIEDLDERITCFGP